MAKFSKFNNPKRRHRKSAAAREFEAAFREERNYRLSHGVSPSESWAIGTPVKKAVADGWHTIYGHSVYVEDGKVLRGMKKDHNGHDVYASVYRYNRKLRCWVIDNGITVAAFRAGVARETICLS